jgi:uncharacterized protein YegP (UPF0339 family)
MNRRTALAALVGAAAVLAVPGRRDAHGQASRLTFEVYRDNRREFRWRLKSGNGRVIATSGDGYQAKAGCLAGIELVRQGANGAEIEDLTE